MTVNEIIGRAIYDAMDVADGLDSTVADRYAAAVVKALGEAGYEVVQSQPAAPFAGLDKVPWQPVYDGQGNVVGKARAFVPIDLPKP